MHGQIDDSALLREPSSHPDAELSIVHDLIDDSVRLAVRFGACSLVLLQIRAPELVFYDSPVLGVSWFPMLSHRQSCTIVRFFGNRALPSICSCTTVRFLPNPCTTADLPVHYRRLTILHDWIVDSARLAMKPIGAVRCQENGNGPCSLAKQM